ncbi:MAG TPA: adenylate/guanylate cyclase domain-containing protein, partial [Sphingomonadaceae bacterium]|nr:adenylate/guanylate cyclase domain-containing protein [Sphingomonadaceae bacterium]
NPDAMPLNREHFLRAFLARIASPNVHPASIRLLTDASDNVIRNWPDRPAGLPPLLADALTAGRAGPAVAEGPIRFRRPLYAEDTVFPEITLQFLADPNVPDAALRPLVAGRYVLIGGDLDDVDQFKTPETRVTGLTIAGLKIHAHMLTQRLDGIRYAHLPTPPLWAVALLFVAGGALTRLFGARLWVAGPLFAVQAAIALFLPFWIQARGIDTQGMPVFGWAVGWLTAFVAVGMAMNSVGARQRKIAQSALGKYLPRDIASEILRDPTRLALHGEKRAIYALFTDLEGFTKLSHAIQPETVALLLNRYLDLLSEVVLRHGGTIDKFVGDAVVAFWGAPIARPDDGERAAQAAVAMYAAGEAFRRDAPAGVPPIGRTRIGLHRGDAIVGNFGGEGRIQYTALGDSMNLAARLEGANKTLKTRALVSETAVAGVTSVPFRPMGRVVVRGRATPIAVYEPAPDMNKTAIASCATLYSRCDRGEPGALEDFVNYSNEHPEDAALANLVYRLREVGPGGSFVLE